MSSPVIAGASAASGPARERVYEWLRDEIIRHLVPIKFHTKVR